MKPDLTTGGPPLAAAYQQLVDASEENGGLDVQRGLEDIQRRAIRAEHASDDATTSRSVPPSLTPAAVRNKRFSTTRLRSGYDEEEVDAFLDEVEAELDRLIQEIERLRMKLAEAESASDGPPPPTEGHSQDRDAGNTFGTVARVLALAQQTADLAIAEARQEADETLDRSRREASDVITTATQQAGQITSDARAWAEGLERDAQERHRQAVESLVQSREELERRVDDLRAFEREYRARLKASLEGQLRDLEAGADDSGVFPAVATTGQQPAVPGRTEHAQTRPAD